jgi:hypothetical protein
MFHALLLLLPLLLLPPAGARTLSQPGKWLKPQTGHKEAKHGEF